MWWHKPLIPELGRQRLVELWVWGQPGLLSKFSGQPVLGSEGHHGKQKSIKDVTEQGSCCCSPAEIGKGHKEKSVRPPDELHTVANSKQIESYLFIFKKQACFSHLPALMSCKNKYRFPEFHIKTTFKPKITLSFWLTWLNIEPGTSCPYKGKRWQT